MRQVWHSSLVLLGSCLFLAGCLTSACHTCKEDPGCELSRLAQHYRLEEGEIVLTPEEVQRRAVLGSGMGNALETDADEREAHPCLACSPSRKRDHLARLLKAYASDEVRNQTAGLALEAYFGLAEARLQLRLTLEALEIADRAVTKAEELKRKGLSLPVELTTLRSQRGEVISEHIKLELLRDRLTEQIRQLTDGKILATQIATVEIFHVLEEPLDDDLAIAIGLKHRPDLNLLRAALCNLDASTLPLIHQLLGGMNPLLGDKVRRCIPLVECLPRILPLLARGELGKVRRELTSLLCERERQAVAEIRQALRQVRATARLAAQAQHREELAQQRLAEIEERQRKGISTEGDLPQAQRDHIKKRGQVLHEAIQWEIARVQLRKAQGLLVYEVLGHHGPNPFRKKKGQASAQASPQHHTLLPCDQ